jgi:hypothetical protein
MVRHRAIPAARRPTPLSSSSGARSSRRAGDSATFARALTLFGRRKLIDLVALMGNYAATAAMLTTFDMQLDPDQPPPLPV